MTSKLIEEAAERATKRLAAKKVPAPFPITMVMDFVQSEMADKAMIMPGAKWLKDRKVEYVANDMVTIYFAFRTLLALAR